MAPQWKEWKLRQQGYGRGTLRPPTPVAPRPPMVANPSNQGATPMGNGYKRLTLPGPGPSAGGRYNMYYPGQPTKPRNVTPRPATSSFYEEGGWNDALKKAAMKGLVRQIARLSPYGKALDLGFSLMTGDWGITDPGSPAVGPTLPLTGSGWQQLCRSTGSLQKMSYYASVNNTPYCTLGLQVPHNNYGVGIAIPAGQRTLYIGPATNNGTRFTIASHWIRPAPAPTPAVSWTPAIPARQRVVQPLPASMPESYPDPYHDPSAGPRPRPSTATGVRYKPSPYNPPPDKRPPGETPVKNLPQKGEQKYKVPDTGWIGDLYGFLTEIKDGLKCYEKNAKGLRPKGGLADRIARAAAHTALNPDSIDWEGFIKCLVYNHFEDAAIGKANQLANRITKNPYWKRPVGVGAGTWSARMS